MKKVGLVLEGGAMRGMYTAGILDSFLDNNIKVDCILGVSAGALFGVNYCSKQKGRALRYNKKYIKDSRYMSLKSLIKTGNLVNTEFAYHEVPFKLDVFDEETYSKSKTDFYAVITNIKTGKAEYKKLIKEISNSLIIEMFNYYDYLNNSLFNPRYLFHGSPKLLEIIEMRQAYDSCANYENEDYAVFLTSSFIIASAYAFKDTIKKLSDGLDWNFEIGYDNKRLANKNGRYSRRYF